MKEKDNDIKVGDKVFARYGDQYHYDYCEVDAIKRGLFFNSFIVCAEDSQGKKVPFKKYRWQLFKIG